MKWVVFLFVMAQNMPYSCANRLLISNALNTAKQQRKPKIEVNVIFD